MCIVIPEITPGYMSQYCSSAASLSFDTVTPTPLPSVPYELWKLGNHRKEQEKGFKMLRQKICTEQNTFASTASTAPTDTKIYFFFLLHSATCLTLELPSSITNNEPWQHSKWSLVNRLIFTTCYAKQNAAIMFPWYSTCLENIQ